MADEVVNVIHKLTFDVNSTALEQSTQKLDQQIQSIDTEVKKLGELKKAFENTAESELAEREKLQKAINDQIESIEKQRQGLIELIKTDQKLQAEITKETALLHKYQQAQQGATTSSNKLSNASMSLTQVIRELPAAGVSLNTLVLALSNNIPQLVTDFQKLTTETGSSSKALTQLGSTIFSTGNLITIAISIWTIWGKDIMEAVSGLSEADKALSEFNKELKETDKNMKSSVNQEIAHVNVLTQIAADTSAAMNIRINATKELQKLYPEYFGQLTQEAILNGNVKNAIDEVTKALIAKAYAQSAEKKGALALDEIDRLKMEKDKHIQDGAKQYAKTLDLIAQKEAQLNAARKKESPFTIRQTEISSLEEDLMALKSSRDLYLNTIIDFNRKIEGTTRFMTAQFAEAAKQGVAAGNQFIKQPTESKTPKAKKFKIPKTQLMEFLPTSYDWREAVRSRKFRLIDSGDRELQSDIKKGAKEQVDLWKKESADGIKSMNKNVSAALKGITGLIEDVYSNMFQRQVTLLDREIAYREDRMRYAIELAKRGNTAILEEEQKRLDQAQRNREIAGKRQLQLNSLISASNMALAATEAIKGVMAASANTGTTAGIIGFVAALIAGVAAVAGTIIAIGQAFKSTNASFADGGYTGDGSKYEYAGSVHKAEFVMPKDKTRRYRPILNAMYSGRFPMLSESFLGTGSSQSDKQFLSKMDEMIGAVREEKVIVHNRMDEGGWFSMTERVRGRDRKRWK